MAARAKKTFWRRCRTCFRWFRVLVLLFVLLLAAALLYLNRVGLPDFVKQPVLEKLRARGFNLQFSRLRWHLENGIVAENVRFGRTNSDLSVPTFTARQMQVRINYAALLHRQFQLDGFTLRQGNLAWTITATNEPPRELSATNIQTQVRLLPGDAIELEKFQAQFAGVHLELTGVITNASAMRNWKFFQTKPSVGRGNLEARLRRLADTLEKIHFAAPPELKMDVHGDALDLQSFALRFSINAPNAETPWGNVYNGAFTALLRPASNDVVRAELKLHAASALTRWASTTNLVFRLDLSSTQAESDLVHANLNLTADSTETQWGVGENLQLQAQWLHSITNPFPLSGSGDLQLGASESKWGKAQKLQVALTLLNQTNITTETSWAWWTNFAPFAVNWEARVSGVQSPKLQAEEILCAGQWCAPEVRIEKVSAKLYDGNLNADAKLDVATRDVSFSAVSDFDAQKIGPLLTPRAREWLANYSWETPPYVKAEGALVMPAWTNRNPDWRGEVQPTLKLSGEFHGTNCAFRGVEATSAESHFTYTNMVWRLPDLVVTRPEGQLHLFHEASDWSKNYYFRIHSTIDLRALRPLFSSNQWHEAELVSFTQPPVIDGEVWGRWHDHERIGARAHLVVTNFALREQTASFLEATLEYTNKFLKVIEPRCYRGAEEIRADSVLVDFEGRKAYLTNGFGHMDAQAFIKVLGPKIGKHMEPYVFHEAPTVHANGIIPFHDRRLADLHFVVDGRDFEWWKFHSPHISGRIDWVGEQLWLKDVAADFYKGTAVGKAEFDFKPEHGANFNFDVVATDADIHLLAQDLTGKTNKLEGLLTARLDVTEGSSTNWQTLQGAGRANLRDGLIWDIPIFGIFSPVLNTIMPGLGNSRAREASATFSIRNGVAHSDDLEIRTLMARLQYRGTADLEGKVNANVEAELLRNTWVLGPVISLALWPVSKVFEYKITGTLHDPKIETKYIPQFIFVPFHPVKSLREMLPENSSTNAPPPSEEK